jgi:DNA-binding MarR family transcriptional regulator
MKNITLGKLAAIITQNGHCYYDRALCPYGIGWGQQFLLLCIHNNQGISILKLAKKGILDQSTTTRALQKLHRRGYIDIEVSSSDRRMRNVYTTQKALPVIEETLLLQKQWNEILVDGMSENEINDAHRLLGIMAKNAYMHMHVQDDEPWERDSTKENINDKQ